MCLQKSCRHSVWSFSQFFYNVTISTTENTLYYRNMGRNYTDRAPSSINQPRVAGVTGELKRDAIVAMRVTWTQRATSATRVLGLSRSWTTPAYISGFNCRFGGESLIKRLLFPRRDNAQSAIQMPVRVSRFARGTKESLFFGRESSSVFPFPAMMRARCPK